MSNTPPFFDKICKRSARFILACVQSESSFIRSTVRYGIFVGRCNSFIGRNGVLLCSRFKWQFNDFVCGNVNLNNYELLHNFFIVVLGMMIGLLLSSWRRFFVSGMMILEYSLVMAEGCQRQN